MLKEFGQIASLLKQAPKIREEFERFQQRLGQITAEGDAGGGMVTVRVNGRMEVLACHISEDILKPEDREFVEELVRAATNQALNKVRQLVADESSKLAMGLNLPGMPDLSGLLGPTGG